MLETRINKTIQERLITMKEVFSFFEKTINNINTKTDNLILENLEEKVYLTEYLLSDLEAAKAIDHGEYLELNRSIKAINDDIIEQLQKRERLEMSFYTQRVLTDEGFYIAPKENSTHIFELVVQGQKFKKINSKDFYKILTSEEQELLHKILYDEFFSELTCQDRAAQMDNTINTITKKLKRASDDLTMIILTLYEIEQVQLLWNDEIRTTTLQEFNNYITELYYAGKLELDFANIDYLEIRFPALETTLKALSQDRAAR